jgi:hypothetical protein
MQQVEEGILVNDPSRPDLPVLSRHQVWQGLVMKAEDATQFVSLITYCKVLERHEDGLVRETNFGDGRMRERVTFFPEERVRFEQLDGPLQGGFIDNIIDVDSSGDLRLLFVFGGPNLGRAGGPPGARRGGAEPVSGAGSGGPPGGASGMNTVYRQALENTLATVRRLVQEGKLQ